MADLIVSDMADGRDTQKNPAPMEIAEALKLIQGLGQILPDFRQ